MLSAYEFKFYIVRSNALPISLTTRQRWVHVNLRACKEAGFSLVELTWLTGALTGAWHPGPGTHCATEAKAAGFTIEQMKAAGYEPDECNKAGFSLEELTGAGHLGPSTHTAQEAKAAGYTIEQMKAAGYAPWACKEVGFSFEEARRAGFQPSFSDDATRDYWFSTERECRYWG